MRRDYFTPSVEAFDGDGSRRPVLTVEYDGPAEGLEDRMTKGGSMLGDSDVDVAYPTFTPASDAGAYQIGTPPVLALAPLEGAGVRRGGERRVHLELRCLLVTPPARQSGSGAEMPLVDV